MGYLPFCLFLFLQINKWQTSHLYYLAWYTESHQDIREAVAAACLKAVRVATLAVIAGGPDNILAVLI